MTAALAIATREYRSLFRSPAGWISIALFLLLTGTVFSLITFQPGSPASLQAFFALSGWLLLPVAPAISMKLMSDEYRVGTIEMLLTSPVSDVSVIAGKFAAALGFVITMLAPTLLYIIVLIVSADPAPDPGPIVAGYLCLILLSCLFLSVGTLASALTPSQTLAFLATLFFLLGLLVVSSTLASANLPPPLDSAIAWLSLTRRIRDFATGVIDLSHIVFFLSWSLWFLVLATAALTMRRWR